MDHLIWKKLSERTEKVGHRIVTHKLFRLPDGRESEWTTTGVPAVAAVVAFTPEGNIITVRQYRAGPEAIMTCPPGGFLDAGQTPQQAAEVELLEETGYRGNLSLLAATPMDGYMNTIQHSFLAVDCHRVAEPQPGADEFMTLDSITPAELLRRIHAGEATDAAAFLIGLYEAERQGLISLPRAAEND